MAEPVSPDVRPNTDLFLFGSAEVTLTARELRVRWENGVAAVIPFATVCRVDIVDDAEVQIHADQTGLVRLALPVCELTNVFVAELEKRTTEVRSHPSPHPVRTSTPLPRPFYVELAEDERWIFYHARRDTLQLAAGKLLARPPDAGRTRTGMT
jgi:hypothetical protein